MQKLPPLHSAFVVAVGSVVAVVSLLAESAVAAVSLLAGSAVVFPASEALEDVASAALALAALASAALASAALASAALASLVLASLVLVTVVSSLMVSALVAVSLLVGSAVVFAHLPPPMLQNICFHLLFEIEFQKPHPTVLHKFGLRSYPFVYPLS